MKTYVYTRFSNEEIRNPVFIVDTRKRMQKVIGKKDCVVIAERLCRK